MRRIALTFIFIIIALGVCSAPLHAFEMRYHYDLSGQRRDGSKLWDITFELYDMAPTDSVRIFVWAVTQSHETLAFCKPDTTWGTFLTDSLGICDTGTIHGPGVKHILWNIGLDAPDREFYSDSIVIHLAAGMPGWEPDSCPIPHIEEKNRTTDNMDRLRLISLISRKQFIMGINPHADHTKPG